MTTLIQLNEYPVRGVLKLLIRDKSTGKNIIFATEEYGTDVREQITTEVLRGIDPLLLQPRVSKTMEEQTERTRKKAEVFTPSWICNKMNNYCDEEWFGRKNVFNRETENGWITNEENIDFGDKSWKNYVLAKRLEITCGEAPYIVSRYDTSTGEIIEQGHRIGILDRKLRVVNENTKTERDWLIWVYKAFESVYGYEMQGDSLLIARINLLVTFAECMQNRWGKLPEDRQLERVTDIICTNIWQMDGLTGYVPYGTPREKIVQLSFFDEVTEDNAEREEVNCSVCDWNSKEVVFYKDLKEGMGMKFDFVVGNPPYQEETSNQSKTNGQASRKNIFHYFQIEADKIASISTVMIYPGGRWIHRSGKGMNSFGLEQINDTKLEEVVFYPNAKEVFPSTAIADGVTIVVKDMNKTKGGFKYTYKSNGNEMSEHIDSPGEELIPLNPNDIKINKKIQMFVENNNLLYLHDAILPRSLFGIESDFVEKNPSKVRNISDDLDTSKEIKLFTNDRAGKSGRAKWFIADRDVITQNQEYIGEWQVVVSSANAGGQKRDNQIEIIDNYSAYGRARVALRSFKTYKEAHNFFEYAKSVVIRYAFLMTDEALTSLAKRVPDFQDYSDGNKWIDFSKNIDNQLFDLIGFESNEIDYMVSVLDSLRKISKSKEMV